MEWKKSYREQIIECTKTGNAFLVSGAIACALFRTECKYTVCMHKTCFWFDDTCNLSDCCDECYDYNMDWDESNERRRHEKTKS